METRRGHQGRELLDQFRIAHDHVRRAVVPGCFHPIREAAGRQTLQALDSQWRAQHIAGQILHWLSSAWSVWRPAASRDRKSTRLKSSHSQISYAVFFFKKKKTSSREN